MSDSKELKPIILYDIPCTTSPVHSWSPHTMKTRYCLGYKGLPFTTVWVEFPDIAGLLKSKGIMDPPYTLPAIEDPNTGGTVVVDSLAIAAYLDKTYPETPAVLSAMAHKMLERVGDVFSFGSRGGVNGGGAEANLAPRLIFLVLACARLNPRSREYYVQTRTARLGEQWMTLAEAIGGVSRPEERVEHVRAGVEAIRGVWHRVTALYGVGLRGKEADEEGTSRPGGPFVLGEEPCFLDFEVAGRVKFILQGLDPSEAEMLGSLEDGRLTKLVEDLERYLKY